MSQGKSGSRGLSPVWVPSEKKHIISALYGLQFCLEPSGSDQRWGERQQDNCCDRSRATSAKIAFSVIKNLSGLPFWTSASISQSVGRRRKERYGLTLRNRRHLSRIPTTKKCQGYNRDSLAFVEWKRVAEQGSNLCLSSSKAASLSLHPVRQGMAGERWGGGWRKSSSEMALDTGLFCPSAERTFSVGHSPGARSAVLPQGSQGLAGERKSLRIILPVLSNHSPVCFD